MAMEKRSPAIAMQGGKPRNGKTCTHQGRLAQGAQPHDCSARPQWPCPAPSCTRTAANANVHRPGTGSFFGPFRAERCACPLPAREGQSSFRGARPKSRDSPCERFQQTVRLVPQLYIRLIVNPSYANSTPGGRLWLVVWCSNWWAIWVGYVRRGRSCWITSRASGMHK